MTRKSFVSLIALLTVAAMILAACGGGDDEAEPTNTSPAAGGGPTTEATAGGGTAGGEGTSPAEGTSGTGGGGDLAAQGEQLYNSLGCAGCHTTDGSDSVGPTWQGLWGHEVTFESGESTTVDEAYVTESIREPSAKIVEGFTPAMPAFGPDQVSDQDIQAIIAFMKTLSDSE